MKNKIWMLRIFRKEKRLTLILFFTCIFVATITLLGLYIVEADQELLCQNLYDKYGKYFLRIEKNINPKTISEVNKLHNVQDVREVKLESANIENVQALVWTGNNDFMDMMNSSLILGKLPQKETEIAVDQRYFRLKKQLPVSMIGEKIVLQLDNNMEKKEYTVSGILETETTSVSEETEINVIKYGKVNNSILVALVKLNNYEEDIDKLINILKIKKEDIYLNFELINSLNLLSEKNSLEKNEKYYIVFWVLVVISSLIVIYNVIKLLVLKCEPDLINIHIIGVPVNTLTIILYLYMFVIVGGGIVVGLILATIASWRLNNFLDINKSFSIIIQQLSVEKLLLCYSSFIILTLIIESFAILKIKRKGKTTTKIKHAFQNNRMWVLKMAIIHLKQAKITTVLGTLILAVLISVLTIGTYATNFSLLSYKQMVNYPCQFEYYYDDSLNKEKDNEKKLFYNKLNNVLGEECLFPSYSSIGSIMIETDRINEEYKMYLSCDISRDMSFYAEKELNICVLGYTKEEIRQLYKINKISSGILKENECFIVNRPKTILGQENFCVDFKQIKKINVTNCFNNKTEEYKIKSYVNELLFYPPESYNNVCVIMSENNYKKFVGCKYPNKVYFNHKLEDMPSNIKETSLGVFSNPIKEKNDGYMYIGRVNILMYLFVIILGISIIIALVFFLITHQLKNKDDYTMMKAMGIYYLVLYRIYLYKIMIMATVGIGVSYVVSYIVCIYVEKEVYSELVTYKFYFPYSIFVLSSVLINVALILGSIIIFNNMKKIPCVVELKKH